jgi:hypothetical protein
MTCTYYGGTTAKFVTDVIRNGIRPDPNVPDCFTIPDVNGIWLFADGSNVACSVSPQFKGLTNVLCRDLDTPLIRDELNFQAYQAISLEFLASCKLLDMHAYTDALRNNPSPIALCLAIQLAKVSLKPDFPRTRKGGVNVLDFIEDLTYFDLQPFKVHNFRFAFKTATNEVMSGHIRNESDVSIRVNAINWGRGGFSKAAYKNGDHVAGLNLEFFEQLGLLDIAKFEVYKGVMSPPEAFQRDVREAVGYHVPEASSIELPSDLLGDD